MEQANIRETIIQSHNTMRMGWSINKGNTTTQYESPAFRNNWITSSSESWWRSQPAPHVVFLLSLIHLGQYGWGEMTHSQPPQASHSSVGQKSRPLHLVNLSRPKSIRETQGGSIYKAAKFVVVSQNAQTRHYR